jgi:DNA polymerase elongation subunit (family B)
MIDVEQLDHRLVISHFTENGSIDFKEIEVPESEMFEWEHATQLKHVHPGWESWNGKKIKKRKSRFLSRYRIEEFLFGLDESVTHGLYEGNMPKVWYCDIEVEVTDDGFPEPSVAPNPVTTICLCSKGSIVVMMTKELNSSEMDECRKEANEYFSKWEADFDIKFRYFPSEREMLYVFFHKYMQKISLLTGWNFINFDWLYLVNRAAKYGIDATVSSPSGKYIDEELKLPQHRPIVDYMQIYKKFDTKVLVKESSTLDYVSEQVLNVNKLKYNGTLQDLYKNDFKKYVLYNIIDTLLVEYIDRHISVLGTYIQLANTARVELSGAFSPIRMTEALLIREFYQRNKILVRNKSEVVKNKYEGAFVKDPKPGMYEWVVTYDFASLYPTTMRQFNISPETYLGKRDDLSGDGYIKTSSGAVYKSNEDSTTRKILTGLFNLRVQKKEEAKDIEKAIEAMKDLKKYV